MSVSRSGGDLGDRSFLPDEWATLAPLVDQVLDAEPHERDRVLDAVSAGDPARRAAIAQLVAECERDTPVLERPAAERFARLFEEDDELPLPETLGGRYRIERELGRGGMARVYLAHDAKHAREVAVKVIRPDLAASLGRERFLREIAIAARLRHPNIVPVYDSGDADGLLYFVMPYEEGPSLRERIGHGHTLSVSERVSALRDVARALAYAHEHGVVHRDVKPDNVMLSGGAAVVTDFGIAKAVSAAQADGAGTITQTGAGIGTPAYMAPEQAIGDPSTDHRADLYSFGCLAYELFAGKPPFHGMPNHQIIAAHVTTTPEPLSRVAPDAPDGLAELVARCLAKNPGDRPQQASELLAALDASTTGAVAATTHAGVQRTATRSRTVSRLIAAVATLVVLMTAGVYAVTRTGAASSADPAGDLTVAVLPFASIGGDTVRREIAEGFSDELNSALFNVPGLRVVSRGAAVRYRGIREVDPAKVGRELGARVLLTGSVRWSASAFTLTVVLRRAADGEVWFTRPFARADMDVALREEIVRAVEDTLRRRGGALAPGPTVPRAAEYQPNKDAENAYLVGRNQLRRRGLSIHDAIENFRRAVQLDSLYPKAYSALSLALALSPYFEWIPASEVADSTKAVAHRALQLDSMLAEPHVALGLVAQHAFDWTTAQREFDLAMRLRSGGDAEPLVQHGRHLVFRGRLEEGLRQFVSALQLEPGSALVKSWISYAYYLRGQGDSALAWSDSAFIADSSNMTTLTLGSLVQLAGNRVDRARMFAVKGPLGTSLYVLARVGDTTAVRERLALLQDSPGRVWLPRLSVAFASLGRGDTAAALGALVRATDASEMWPSIQSVCDPLYDPLRGTARFAAVLRRVGLPDLAAPGACPRITR